MDLPADIDSDMSVSLELDSDSGISDGESTWTTSLLSSVLNYRSENGRTYHSYREGKYALPNDEIENDRLDLQNALFSITLNNRLFLAPVKNVHDCLDIGTGTGIWAIDFADDHPESYVIGTDLSPIQPTNIPPNLKFLVDDVEDEWNYHERFDFIHARMMVGSIQDWDKFVNNCVTFLRPGGWVELQDAYRLGCDDDSLKQDSSLVQWLDISSEAFEKMGRPIDVANKHKERLIKAGLVDVQEVVYKWPINSWPKDNHLKQIGIWSRENTLQALESLSLAPLTRVLGWSQDEVQVLLAKARKDIINLNIHAYWKMYFVFGRKP